MKKKKERLSLSINKEEKRIYNKKYCSLNKQKLKFQHKNYYINNKNLWIKRSKTQRYKDYVNKYEKRKRKSDPIWSLKSKIRRRLSQVIHAKNHNPNNQISKYGVDYKAIVQHLQPFPLNIKAYHIDHIKPLCSFDLTNPEQIKLAFAPENHQWLLAEDNLKKGGKF